MHSNAPPRTMVAESSRDLINLAQIHDFSTQHLKPLRRKRLSEEVSIVIIFAYKGHHNFLSFDHIANEEMSSRDVFRPIMMFRVV